RETGVDIESAGVGLDAHSSGRNIPLFGGSLNNVGAPAIDAQIEEGPANRAIRPAIQHLALARHIGGRVIENAEIGSVATESSGERNTDGCGLGAAVTTTLTVRLQHTRRQRSALGHCFYPRAMIPDHSGKCATLSRNVGTPIRQGRLR